MDLVYSTDSRSRSRQSIVRSSSHREGSKIAQGKRSAPLGSRSNRIVPPLRGGTNHRQAIIRVHAIALRGTAAPIPRRSYTGPMETESRTAISLASVLGSQGKESPGKLESVRTHAPGPAGALPLSAEMLLSEPSGNLFGLTQNAGMGWDPSRLLDPEFLILSTHGGLRAEDG